MEIDPLTTYTVTKCPNGTTQYQNLLYGVTTPAEARQALESANIFKPVHFSRGAVFDANRTTDWDYGVLRIDQSGGEMDYAPTWYQTDACWVAIEKDIFTGCVTYHITKAVPPEQPPSPVRVWSAQGIVTDGIDILVGSQSTFPPNFPTSGAWFRYEQSGSAPGSLGYSGIGTGVRVWDTTGIIANEIDIFVGLQNEIPSGFPASGLRFSPEQGVSLSISAVPSGARLWNDTGIVAYGVDIFLGQIGTIPLEFPNAGLLFYYE